MGEKIHRGELLSAFLEDIVTARDGKTGLLDNLILVQEDRSASGAAATGTTVFVEDDNVPTSSQGFEVLTLVFTPKDASNILEISAQAFVAHTVAAVNSKIALYKDADATALAVGGNHQRDANRTYHLGLQSHRFVAGTISPITFRIRIGAAFAGTMTLNGTLGARTMGGAYASFLSVKEYRPS